MSLGVGESEERCLGLEGYRHLFKLALIEDWALGVNSSLILNGPYLLSTNDIVENDFWNSTYPPVAMNGCFISDRSQFIFRNVPPSEKGSIIPIAAECFHQSPFSLPIILENHPCYNNTVTKISLDEVYLIVEYTSTLTCPSKPSCLEFDSFDDCIIEPGALSSLRLSSTHIHPLTCIDTRHYATDITYFMYEVLDLLLPDLE